MAIVAIGPITSAKIAQPIKDRAIEAVVQQANQNIAAVTNKPRNRTFTMRTRFGNTIYDGKAKLEIATAKPAKDAPIHLCVRVNSLEGKKIDIATKLPSGSFSFTGGMWNERCYTAEPNSLTGYSMFRPNPRVSFGANGPQL